MKKEQHEKMAFLDYTFKTTWGQWLDSDGRPIVYSNWLHVTPPNYTGTSCSVIKIQDQSSQFRLYSRDGWDGQLCDIELPVICQFPRSFLFITFTFTRIFIFRLFCRTSHAHGTSQKCLLLSAAFDCCFFMRSRDKSEVS